MVAQICPPLFEWRGARSVIAFGREQPMTTPDPIVEGLRKGAGIDAPLNDVDLATAGGRPAPRGQSVDRRPGSIFGVVVRNDAAINEPSLESLAPSPKTPFQPISLNVDKPSQHRGRPWN